MFKRQTSHGLDLVLDDEVYSFGTPKQFEFALSGRTSVPPSKVASLMALPDESLRREAEGIRAVEKRFSETLSSAVADDTLVGPFLRELDATLISQDHEWRAIINALNATERSFEEYKKVALVKYMQYLTARQEIIKTIFNGRQTSQQIRAAQESANAPPVDPMMRETVIFDVASGGDMDARDVEFSRIPKGETVEIDFEPEQEVVLMLAKHQFRIALRDHLVFVDDHGQDSVLRKGKSIVGRDATSDIVLDAGLRDISRKHLIVETSGDSMVRLTDISSHGTLVPPEFLENTSI